MVESDRQRKARSYIAGAAALLSELQYPGGAALRREELEASAALIDLAQRELDGKDEAREKKNAADRERRAKAKTRTWSPPKKKSAPKRPAAGGIIDAL